MGCHPSCSLLPASGLGRGCLLTHKYISIACVCVQGVSLNVFVFSSAKIWQAVCSHHHKSLVQHDRWRKLGGLSCGNSDTYRTVSLLPSLPERNTFPVSLLIILGMNALLIATTFFIRFVNGPRDSKSIKNDCTFWL